MGGKSLSKDLRDKVVGRHKSWIMDTKKKFKGVINEVDSVTLDRLGRRAESQLTIQRVQYLK